MPNHEPMVEKVRKLLSSGMVGLSSEPVSLDQPAHEDRRRSESIAETLPQREDRSVDDKLDTEYAMGRVMDVLQNKLDPSDALILLRRFGLADDTEWTLERLSEAYGLTRERMRQRVQGILRKVQRMVESDDAQQELSRKCGVCGREFVGLAWTMTGKKMKACYECAMRSREK